MRFDRASSIQLHVGPPTNSPQSDKKKEVFQEHVFFNTNAQMYEQCPPKGIQMGEFISVMAPLGAPLEPQSVFFPKKCSQSTPKMTPRVQK